jgi:hypothetical protein
MIEVQLTASDFQLELYVEGYEFPNFDTGRDANALTCEIELDLRRRLDLHAAHSLILYTYELANFVDQLRALEHAHDGKATLGDPHDESGDEFGLTIQLKKGSGGTLAGCLADSITARLSFEMIDIDQTFVRDALAQFAAIVEAFPIRDDITAN